MFRKLGLLGGSKGKKNSTNQENKADADGSTAPPLQQSAMAGTDGSTAPSLQQSAMAGADGSTAPPLQQSAMAGADEDNACEEDSVCKDLARNFDGKVKDIYHEPPARQVSILSTQTSVEFGFQHTSDPNSAYKLVDNGDMVEAVVAGSASNKENHSINGES